MLRQEREESMKNMLNQYYERYDIDFEQEFYVKELVKTKSLLQNTPDEHVKTKLDLMQLISRIEQQLNLKKKINTIPLIDEFDYITKYKTTEIDDNNSLILKLNMTNILKNKLIAGKEQNKLIDVTGFRAIGKTRALIEFAKENNYIVIIPSKIMVNEYTMEYENIYHQSDTRLRGTGKIDCVVDEGVDINRVKNELGLNIITGYINNNNK